MLPFCSLFQAPTNRTMATYACAAVFEPWRELDAVKSVSLWSAAIASCIFFEDLQHCRIDMDMDMDMDARAFFHLAFGNGQVCRTWTDAFRLIDPSAEIRREAEPGEADCSKGAR